MGDYVRWAPPYYGSEDQQALGTRSALYLALNRGKRSIRLDLKSEAAARRCCGWRVSTTSCWRAFGPASSTGSAAATSALREANPGIVYCAITGYGQTGPNTDRAGHDMNYLGLNGLLGLTGEPDGRPIQSAGQIADVGGGALMAAFGVMAALRERERSGEGQLVDVSMTDGSLAWLAMVAAAVPVRRGGAASAAADRSPAASPATSRTRRRTAGSPAARWSRSSGANFCEGWGART